MDFASKQSIISKLKKNEKIPILITREMKQLTRIVHSQQDVHTYMYKHPLNFCFLVHYTAHQNITNSTKIRGLYTSRN